MHTYIHTDEIHAYTGGKLAHDELYFVDVSVFFSAVFSHDLNYFSISTLLEI